MFKSNMKNNRLSDNLTAYQIMTINGSRRITLQDVGDGECVMILPEEVDIVINFLERVRDWLLEEEGS